MTCQHENIQVAASVVTMQGYGHKHALVLDRSIMIEVHCGDCGQPFQFKGQPGGASPNHPRISTDLSTLCAPIEPAPVVINHDEDFIIDP